jgi:hypothetical protein
VTLIRTPDDDERQKRQRTPARELLFLTVLVVVLLWCVSAALRVIAPAPSFHGRIGEGIDP